MTGSWISIRSTISRRITSPFVSCDAQYADTVQRFYRLNERELEMLERHRFLVTDRIRYQSFGEAFFTIYKRDLPVFLSSDAILHAWHMSYSEILQNLEHHVLLPRLEHLLGELHGQMGALDRRYGENRIMKQSLQDMDLYLTIPLMLLGKSADPFYDENNQRSGTDGCDRFPHHGRVSAVRGNSPDP
jgi:hypothetical protein